MATTKVTTGGITDATIATADIADDAVTSAKIADGTIVAANIANDTITATQLANDSANVNVIVDGAVTTAKLAGDAVTAAKIADDAVGAEHIEQLDADLSFADSAKAKFGAGNDLEISHDGSNSKIHHGGSGGLKVTCDDFQVQKNDGSEWIMRGQADGAVELYHDNVKKFETNANGAKISGTGSTFLEINSTDGTVNPMVRMTNGDKTWDAGLRGDNNDNYVIRDHTASASRLTIDTSGNVGIGITSPDLPLHVEGSNNADLYKAFRITNGGGSAGTMVAMEFECGVDEIATISANNAGSDIGNLMFATARSSTAYPTEAMRIDSDGALLVNQTSKQYSDLKFAVTGSNQNLVYFDCAGNGNNYALTIKHGYAYSGSNGIALRFLNSGGTQVGRIDVGQSTTGYVTSSDYRLKENATAISDGITRLKTLKPYQFNWIAEKGQPKVDGFFAHEVTSAVPEAITGTKDEVDSDKKPVYQGIDQSKLVPLLTAALQEAITKIETLEKKVAALEAK